MLRVHKIALDPNNVQETFFKKAAGCARFAFNWALEQWNKRHEAGEKPNEAALRREFNAIKADAFPFFLEIPKTVPQQAIKNLGAAFNRFFNHVQQGRRTGAKKNPYGRPRFKKRGQHDSFRMDNGPPSQGVDAVKIDGHRIYVPKLGWVRMRERVRFQGWIKSAVISRVADRWFVSLTMDVEDHVLPRKSHGVVGVDLGIKTLAMLSNGEAVPGPKPLKRLLKKLARLSRSLARKVKGGANYRKLKARIARLHARMANLRREALHQLSHKLASGFALIGIENLNVSGMLKNGKLSRAIADMGFYELRRQLTYKVAFYGGRLIVVDRWLPSSKACSGCGGVKDEIALAMRTYECAHCGLVIDRDLNAALNIETAASSAVTA
jgi:putative transposase